VKPQLKHNIRNQFKQLLREVVTEVETVHDDLSKQKEVEPEIQADIVDTDNQLDTGLWGEQDAHPNIVHGSW
jgi:hypothetical protein